MSLLLSLGWAELKAAPPTTIPAAVVTAEPLRADELILVYNGTDRASRALAARYARARGVPGDRFCPLQIDPQLEEIAFSLYEESVRNPVRAFLRERRLEDQVRGIVTFYGLPIRVGASRPLPDAHRLRAEWEKQFDQALGDLLLATQKLAPIAELPPPEGRPTTRPADQYLPMLQSYARIRNAAHHRLRDRAPLIAADPRGQMLLMILEQIEGQESLFAQMQVNTDAADEQTLAAIEQARRELREGLAQADRILAGPLDSPDRELGRRLVLRYRGLLGFLASLHNDLNCLAVEESTASLDSELMLLWWDGYPRQRWMPNMLSWQMRTSQGLQAFLPPGHEKRRVMIVGRIDGPSEKVARRLIDDALAAEQAGLDGEVYLDARGITSQAGYVEYDQDLRDLAALLKKYTSLPVHLDDTGRLFQPGECPRAMLYCGWYSLRQYIPAFQFVTGAVGYHIASFEAISLKRPGETGWCRGLLTDGVVATLGPVAEPYLQSFPRPTAFFGLLLTGNHTLGECYAFTVPMTSWMQVLIGDPLYRPFARKPLLALEQVFPPERIPPEFRRDWGGS